MYMYMYNMPHALLTTCVAPPPRVHRKGWILLLGMELLLTSHVLFPLHFTPPRAYMYACCLHYPSLPPHCLCVSLVCICVTVCIYAIYTYALCMHVSMCSAFPSACIYLPISSCLPYLFLLMYISVYLSCASLPYIICVPSV